MPLLGPPPPESAIEAHLSRQAAEEGRAREGLHPALKYGPAAASLFDAWTTQQALERGAMEANPIMAPFADTPAAMYAVKGAQGLLTGLLADRLYKSGHPTAAKIAASFNIALPLGAGIYNHTRVQR